MVITYKQEQPVAADPIVQKLLLAIQQHLDFPGLAAAAIDGALKDELNKIVKDTSNPFDDILMAAVYPTLSAAIEKAVSSAWANMFASLLAPPAPASPGSGLGAAVDEGVLGASV